MRKLHLFVFNYSNRGHANEYVKNFCNKLSDQFEIILYVGSKSEVETPPNVAVEYENIDISKIKAERFLMFGKFSNLVKHLQKQPLILSYVQKCFNKKKIRKEDVVYVMDHSALSLLLVSKKLAKIKPTAFVWIHSARFESRDFIYNTYKRIFRYMLDRQVLKSFKGMVVNGEFIKKQMADFLEFESNKIHVIQYPSEIQYKPIPKMEAREKLGFNEDQEIVLFFGGLRMDKNIEEVVRSTANASNKPMLIIAGSESTVSRQQLMEWIKKHGHENYFLDISYVSEEKMALYYSASDVLLLTYGAESASQSGPLSLAREFLLPAIVTDAGEIGYYIKNNNIGLVASPLIENDFSRKIETFFEKDLSKEFRPNLEEAKEKFSWDNAAAKYVKLFGN